MISIADNIEQILFDYVEGNLSETDIAKIDDFLIDNPQFSIDLDCWSKSFLTPTGSVLQNHDFLLLKPNKTLLSPKALLGVASFCILSLVVFAIYKIEKKPIIVDQSSNSNVIVDQVYEPRDKIVDYSSFANNKTVFLTTRWDTLLRKPRNIIELTSVVNSNLRELKQKSAIASNSLNDTSNLEVMEERPQTPLRTIDVIERDVQADQLETPKLELQTKPKLTPEEEVVDGNNSQEKKKKKRGLFKN